MEEHMRILIVDDNATNLMLLKIIAQRVEGVSVEGCECPVRALEMLQAADYDLILVDYVMPKMNGSDLIRAVRSIENYQVVPIVMITGENDRQVRLDAISAGATDFLNKPVDPIELRARLGNLLALRRAQRDLANHAQWLEREVAKATRHLNEREEEVIWRLSRAIEFRDGGTGEHISRVATVSRLIAEGLGCDTEFCRTIYLAAPLHDVGKVGIPDAILTKPGRLTDEEMATMRGHVVLGQRILAGGESSLIRFAEHIVASHHERWDGKGYPAGLAGEEIPLEGRIVAVADVFDALCSPRPYKSAWNVSEACDEINRCAGGHFDPRVVAAFNARWSDILPLYRHAESAAA
jgi:putative two-component system response regulator